MSTDLERDALAVLFPAVAGLELDETMRAFLGEGGRSILLGETRQEYVAREMSPERIRSETAEDFRALTECVRTLAGPALIGVDQELGGIQRLHALVTQLPSRGELGAISAAEVERAARAAAAGARDLGVNLFLAPILDVVVGRNDWLRDRTLGTIAEDVGRLGAAFIRGVQSPGILAAAKHFPGYPWLSGDPATEVVSFEGSVQDLSATLKQFRVAIEAGVKAVMLGPAPIAALDPHHAASTSPAIVALLRKDYAFDGLVISDDLDSAGILRGGELDEAAIDALNAGADLLLVAHGPHLFRLAERIGDAVADGRIAPCRLGEAAGRVRRAAALADQAGPETLLDRWA